MRQTPLPLPLGRIAAATLLAATLTSTAGAQARGTVELGVLGRYTVMADELNVENMPAAGGRVGLFVFRNLSLETDLTYGRADVKDPVAPNFTRYSDPLWNYRALYNMPIGGGRHAFLIGAGYAYDAFGYARTKPRRSGGPSGLLGLRLGFLDRWSLRAEGHGHMGVSRDEDLDAGRPAQDSYVNIGVQLGLSYTFQPFFRTRQIVRVDTVTVRTTSVDTVFRERIRTDTVRAGGGGTPSTVVIGIVNFPFAQYEITSDARRILNEVAASLSAPENRTIRIEVRGNTDAVGGEQANMSLGERRARAVADYLAANGVDVGRITVVSAGKADPVATNATPEGRASNRRAVISIVR